MPREERVSTSLLVIQASWPCHPLLTFHNPSVSPTLTKTPSLTHL